MKQLSHMSIFFLLLFCFACNKEHIKPNTPANYFPNAVGDTWEYDVTDSSLVLSHPNFPRHYSVKVLITGAKKLLDGKDAAVWQYQYPWGNDTNYVRIVADTIKIFDRTYSLNVEDLQYPRQIFLLPFYVNQRWDGKLLWVDSSKILKQENVQTLNQDFLSCFNIYHNYVGPNLNYQDYYWFKPNLGFIKMFYNHYDLGIYTIQSWQLKTYSVH